MADQTHSARELIRAEIEESVMAGSVADYEDLAERIDRRLFGDDGSGAPSYGELIQAEADVRAELKELRGEVRDLCTVLVRDGGDYLEDRSGGGYIDVRSVPLLVAIIREAAGEGGPDRE